jgi:2',3'-cyclic-nucleotide 2'-phosphodiesterase (5'-nucleotidase family)
VEKCRCERSSGNSQKQLKKQNNKNGSKHHNLGADSLKVGFFSVTTPTNDLWVNAQFQGHVPFEKNKINNILMKT